MDAQKRIETLEGTLNRLLDLLEGKALITAEERRSVEALAFPDADNEDFDDVAEF